MTVKHRTHLVLNTGNVHVSEAQLKRRLAEEAAEDDRAAADAALAYSKKVREEVRRERAKTLAESERVINGQDALAAARERARQRALSKKPKAPRVQVLRVTEGDIRVQQDPAAPLHRTWVNHIGGGKRFTLSSVKQVYDLADALDEYLTEMEEKHGWVQPEEES